MPERAPHPGLLRDRYDGLLIANGTPPKSVLLRMLRARADHLIALDGGVDALKTIRMVPDVVAGDLDSASANAVSWARDNGARVRRLPSQDAPDIAKGLRLCRDYGLRMILVAGFSGARTDHVLASLGFAFAVRGMEVTLITDEVIALPLRGRVEREFHVPARHSISWLGYPQAGPCTLAGVRWPFRNRALRLDGFHSLSNRAAGPSVHVRQGAGRSILFVSLFPQGHGKSAPLE